MNLTFVFAVFGLSFLIACQATPPAPKSSVNDYATRMQQLSESLSTLLPLSLDAAQFNLPANQPIVENELNHMSHFSHDLTGLKKRPSDDPGQQFVAKQFSRDMTEAKVQYNMGNRSYARFLVRNATNYCVSCHTQSDHGPQFLTMPKSSYFSKLSSIDKASYLIAVRNFDAGLAEYERAMNRGEFKNQPFENIEGATLKVLSVAVRVKKDPVLAAQITNRIVQAKWAPDYLRRSAKMWSASIQRWKNNTNAAPTLAEVKDLMVQAQNEQKEQPALRGGLIEYLRASEAVHELLDHRRVGKGYAETLLYAGLVAENLKDLDPFTINEAYFEACIQQMPHSKIAKTCYQRLETTLLSNYNELDGASVPASVRDNLTALREVAEPTDSPLMMWGQQHE